MAPSVPATPPPSTCVVPSADVGPNPDAPLFAFAYETALADGCVVRIRRIAAPDSLPVAELLTEAFATAIGATTYKQYLFRNIKAYVDEMVVEAPRSTACLVAEVVPSGLTGPTDGATGAPARGTAGAGAAGLSGRAIGPRAWWPQPDPSGGGTPGATPGVIPGVASGVTSGFTPGGVPAGGAGALAAAAELLGTVEVALTPKPSASGRLAFPLGGSAYACNMAVAPQHRRRGVGRALVEAMEAFAVAGAGARLCHVPVR